MSMFEKRQILPFRLRQLFSTANCRCSRLSTASQRARLKIIFRRRLVSHQTIQSKCRQPGGIPLAAGCEPENSNCQGRLLGLRLLLRRQCRPSVVKHLAQYSDGVRIIRSVSPFKIRHQSLRKRLTAIGPSAAEHRLSAIFCMEPKAVSKIGPGKTSCLKARAGAVRLASQPWRSYHCCLTMT